MKNEIKNLVDEANENADIIVEYLKLVLQRLDKIIEFQQKKN